MIELNAEQRGEDKKPWEKLNLLELRKIKKASINPKLSSSQG